MALLGEMHFIPLGADSWFNLPRDEGVAYASQESWVQNETIRDNILFGQPYDKARYQKGVLSCSSYIFVKVLIDLIKSLSKPLWTRIWSSSKLAIRLKLVKKASH